MIDLDVLLNDIKNNTALICSDDCDISELIARAGTIIEKKIPVISVAPESIEMLWSWLEKEDLAIYARFMWEHLDNNDAGISELSENINSAFKKGADGVQIFMDYKDLPKFISQITPIHRDLFFNKDVFIGLNLNEIGPFDWINVFNQINQINATGLTLYYTDKKYTDYVGIIYGLTKFLKSDFRGHLQFMLNDDYLKIEQTHRLFEKNKPDVLRNIKFFITD